MSLNPDDLTLLSGVQMDHSFRSPPILVNRNIAFSFQAAWTGTPVGNWTLESSCDSGAGGAPAPVNFDLIKISPAGGAAGTLTFSWSLPITYNWIRVGYIFQSGTGLLQTLNFNGR